MAILDDIVAHKQKEIAARKAHQSLSQLEANLSSARKPLSFLEALPAEKTNLILEIKPASPSAGILSNDFEVLPLLEIYNRHADALSVLTDEKYFQGSLNLLEEVIGHTPHPVMCKEFILDPYQIYEARLLGASAVLLIVKILSDEQLQSLHQCILDLGMTPVVEIQNNEEAQRTSTLNLKTVLINNRNLTTFEISFDTTKQLVAQIPPGIPVISASGIETRQDIEQLLPYTNCFLIGSSLMKTPLHSLHEKLRKMVHIDDH